MDGQKLLECEDYDPNRFVDWMRDVFKCRNDAALCYTLEVGPSLLSKIRNKRMPIGNSILVRVSDLLNVSTLEIRKHMFAEIES